MRRRWRASVVGLLVVGLTGACGPEADESPVVQARAVATYSDPASIASVRRSFDGSSTAGSGLAQRVILADGHVSRTEVDDAWEDYAQCMRAAGFAVTPPVWDPVTNTTRIFTYARAGSTTAAGAPTTPATEAPTTPASDPRPSGRSCRRSTP